MKPTIDYSGLSCLKPNRCSYIDHRCRQEGSLSADRARRFGLVFAITPSVSSPMAIQPFWRLDDPDRFPAGRRWCLPGKLAI